MISRVEFQWRKKDEPDQSAELVIRDALKKAGYTVGHIAVQGIWDEDKPQFLGGKWDATRLPHKEKEKVKNFLRGGWARRSQATT